MRSNRESLGGFVCCFGAFGEVLFQYSTSAYLGSKENSQKVSQHFSDILHFSPLTQIKADKPNQRDRVLHRRILPKTWNKIANRNCIHQDYYVKKLERLHRGLSG